MRPECIQKGLDNVRVAVAVAVAMVEGVSVSCHVTHMNDFVTHVNESCHTHK